MDSKNKSGTKGRKTTAVCNKCKLNRDERDTVLCSQCFKRFDFDCIGLSEKLYRLMIPEKRAKWKCKWCTQQNSKLKSTISSGTINRTDDLSNITQRKKNNRPVQNTPHTPNLALSTSRMNTFLDITNEISDDDSLTERLSKSEDFSGLDMYKIEELKEEVSELKTSLMSTQCELENTIIENNDLKRQITKHSNEIKVLKNFCQASTTLPLTPEKMTNMTPININMTKRLSCLSPRSKSLSSTPINGKDELVTILKEKISNLHEQLLKATEEITLLQNKIQGLQTHLHNQKY